MYRNRQAFFSISLQISPTQRVEERLLPTDNASFRGISRTPTTSQMAFFVTLVSDYKPLTNVTKNSILDIAVLLSHVRL